MKTIYMLTIVTILFVICSGELQAQYTASHNQLKEEQSSAEASVRNWYNAFLRLDSVGFFNFWAVDHPDFVYVADGKVDSVLARCQIRMLPCDKKNLILLPTYIFPKLHRYLKYEIIEKGRNISYFAENVYVTVR